MPPFVFNTYNQQKTAGKLARSVVVGIAPLERQVARKAGHRTCIFLYLHIPEISYVSLRIDK